MRNKRLPVDVDSVLGSLKEFQRRTVEYVFRRMYIDHDYTNRFLVADEVGLGKTLVARGIIAKTIEHLWGKIPRIDIIYICSNADIARQNINRLNVTEEKDFALASRITLLPLVLDDIDAKNKGVRFDQRDLNFVSFTPGTSFDMKSNLGLMTERVLLYWLLRDAWHLTGTSPMNLLQGNAGMESFRWRLDYFDCDSYDQSIAKAFIDRLNDYCLEEDNRGKENIRKRFNKLCGKFGYARKHVPPEEARERNQLIGELRSVLAQTCLKSLQPDLIILDEFQRFKYLLENENEDSQLARELFTYADKHTEARVLLLSATPYKMYTLGYEEDDDHYEDFLRTLEFLEKHDMGSLEKFKKLLDDYRKELYRPRENLSNRLYELKKEIELSLKQYMVRTERLSVSNDREGMLIDNKDLNIRLDSSEAHNYAIIKRIASYLSQSDPIEYWRSSPYLLNYMDTYELKNSFVEAAENPETAQKLKQILKQSSILLLSKEEIEKYEKIDPANARLRYLIDDIVDNGLWKLLWLPPSVQYYGLGGVYSDIDVRKITKKLIFSTWRLIPKVIATILSYEAERNIFKSYDNAAINTSDARKKLGRLLRFTKKDDHLSGMSNFGILYPSIILSGICDPLCFRAVEKSGSPLSLNELKRHIRPKIEEILRSLNIKTSMARKGDERWYWVAPMLIDLSKYREETLRWFKQENLTMFWRVKDVEDIVESEDFASNWGEHVEYLTEIVGEDFSNIELGTMPHDLVDVLTLMGIASPANVALRSLLRITGLSSDECTSRIRNAAARIAWAFLRLFNLPESIALIRGMDKREPYWVRVLEYSADGGIQMVLDEYVHCLKESLGLFNGNADDEAEEISEHILDVLGLKTSSLGVDHIKWGRGSPKIFVENFEMRARFAQRFGQGKERIEDGSEESRDYRVRAAFNSPFWPFVIATTSVGQEGLDFHTYCHVIVHWNLPSNPVDFEQREGRIHRYKGHAIRKNLAIKYWDMIKNMTFKDAFEKMFEIAKEESQERYSDIIPYWVLPVDDGVKIERHILALPLSVDSCRYRELKRALTIYRMVFGQNRQSDLIDLLVSRFSEKKINEISKQLRIDLSP